MKVFATAARTSGSRELARAALHPRARPDPGREFNLPHPPASAGNLAILRALGVRTKLNLSQPSDPEEQEADRLAEAFVSRGPVLRQTTGYAGEEEAIARKADNGAMRPTHSLAGLHGTQDAPLAPSLRRDYEQFFGADLSAVRAHTGSQAETAARAFNAQAFTLGNDVYFGRGRFLPESGEGRKLLAHEFAHVVRQ